jgi:biopolymer transport protein ExbD
MIQNQRRAEVDIQINVTPMIDLMIFLIIFFLCATTFTQLEREQEVLLPATRGTGSLSRTLDNNLIINVKKDGETFVSGRKYGEKELESLITDHHARAKGALKVKVRADHRTPYGHVASVLALVERAGVSRPYIDTKQDKLEP